MDSLRNKIKIAINNGWFLNISFSNFIDIIDYLLPSKNFINIEVINSGKNLINNLEINENTLICDIYDIINKEIKYPYYFKLYKDNKRQYHITNSDNKICKTNTLFIDILKNNYDEWKCLKTFQGYIYGILGVAFIPDGRTIVSGSRDNTLKMWSVSDGKCLKTFQDHRKYVYSVAFSPDGRTVVSGSADETLKLWGLHNK